MVETNVLVEGGLLNEEVLPFVQHPAVRVHRSWQGALYRYHLKYFWANSMNAGQFGPVVCPPLC